MHKARAFFYVCAGLFLLALSYHLGARSAGAQAGGSIECAEAYDGAAAAAAVIDRYPWVYFNGSIVREMAPVPGTAPVVACSHQRVVLANGEVWQFNPFDATGNYTLLGTFPVGGPTPVQRESFGALKSRYRGAPATQTTGQDR